MSEITNTDHNEDGFTLIDMVVSMVIGGLLTIMVFNLFNTGMRVSEMVAQPVAKTIATQPAIDALGKAVRNSPEHRLSEDGKALYVLNQENEYVIWHLDEDGLSNGSRSFKGVDDVRFEEVGGTIQASLFTEDGQEVTRSLYSRFPAVDPSQRVFTDTFMKTHAPTSQGSQVSRTR